MKSLSWPRVFQLISICPVVEGMWTLPYLLFIYSLCPWLNPRVFPSTEKQINWPWTFIYPIRFYNVDSIFKKGTGKNGIITLGKCVEISYKVKCISTKQTSNSRYLSKKNKIICPPEHVHNAYRSWFCNN